MQLFGRPAIELTDGQLLYLMAMELATRTEPRPEAPDETTYIVRK